MDCIICKSNSEFLFSKKYEIEPFSSMMAEIDQIEYYKCSNCGFTISKTHCEMSKDRWEKLNTEFHTYLENKASSINQPPYLQQAMMLKILMDNYIISSDESLDFAGGYGTLIKIMKRYHQINNFSIYDPYVQDVESDLNYIKTVDLVKYKTVFNSALFEHITDREVFDHINSLVDEDGCLIIHTLICENIPNDPNWFYLDPPVHCAFHTNKSMEILMSHWNYKASIYVPDAKCWILFKKDIGLEHKVNNYRAIIFYIRKDL